MNKKLTHKKVNIFGKKVPVLVIASIIVFGFVTAALIPYFGIITGSVTASQGLLVDNFTYTHGPIIDSYSDFTSLQSATYVKPHELENEADIQAQGNLVSTCTSTDSCADVDYRAVEYFDNAGADFSSYPDPTSSCTSTVSSGTIQSAIGSATVGDVICVPSGTYTEEVLLNKNVTLVAVNSPESANKAEIKGSVVISADGATLKGFAITSNNINVDLVNVGASGVTVDSNVIKNMAGTGSSINAVRVASYTLTVNSNILVNNNLIQDITNTNKGANGIMVQGNVDGVTLTHNTIKDISSTNTTTWDYAMGIQDTTSGSTAVIGISPKNLVIQYNDLENIQSVTEPGRGFGVDEQDLNLNPADASQVTLDHNNFLNIENDLTNKDESSTLLATDNYFDELKTNVNGASKHEVGDINADWMTKTTFDIAPHKWDQFATLASFPKMLLPDTYTLNTTVTA